MISLHLAMDRVSASELGDNDNIVTREGGVTYDMILVCITQPGHEPAPTQGYKTFIRIFFNSSQTRRKVLKVAN